MTGKELIKHLHMGCGEPLKTDLHITQAAKKALPKKQLRQSAAKAGKTFPVNQGV